MARFLDPAYQPLSGEIERSLFLKELLLSEFDEGEDLRFGVAVDCVSRVKHVTFGGWPQSCDEDKPISCSSTFQGLNFVWA